MVDLEQFNCFECVVLADSQNYYVITVICYVVTSIWHFNYSYFIITSFGDCLDCIGCIVQAGNICSACRSDGKQTYKKYCQHYNFFTLQISFSDKIYFYLINYVLKWLFNTIYNFNCII